MNNACWKKITGFTTFSYLLCFTAQADITREFEKKYQKWRDWREQNMMRSTHTRCQEYKDIVGLGVPALPHIIDKMSVNLDDSLLEWAVHEIAKKRFLRKEWPMGKLGDSISASKMYLEWWQTDRFQTPQQFEEFCQQLREAEKTGDGKAVEEAHRAIQYLGLPVLPHLAGKLEEFPELVKVFSKLVDGKVKESATPAECRRYWEKNKTQYALPGQEEGERKWAALWVEPEEKVRQFEQTFTFPKVSSAAISATACWAMTNQMKSAMGEYVINWWTFFTLGAFTIHNVSTDERIARGDGKVIECKDYSEAKRRAIAEHINGNFLYRSKPPKEIIANSVVEQGKTGDFSIHWKSDKKGIVFVRDYMVVVVSMQVEKDTDSFAKALDEQILQQAKKAAAQ